MLRRKPATLLIVLLSSLFLVQCGRNNLATNSDDSLSLFGLDLLFSSSPINIQAGGLDYGDKSTFNFGTVTVGATAQVITFTVQNTGTENITLSGTPVIISGVDAGDFSFTDPGVSVLAPGATTTFTVTFTPGGSGPRDCVITIVDGVNEPIYSFNLTGIGSATPVPDVSLQVGGSYYATGSSYGFGTVTLGSSSTAVTFTIQNSGAANLTLTGSPAAAIGGTNTADFIVSGPAGTTIASGMTDTFTVTFTPTAVGARNATIRIDSDDPDVGSYVINLRGTGTPQPILIPVTIASNNANTSYAIIGNTIRLSFRANVSIQTPTVTIAGNAAALSGGPLTWTAVYTMQATDIEGIVPFTISNIMDFNGFSVVDATATTNASSVTFDRTAPTAVISGEPAGTSNATVLSVTVSGTDVLSYRYKVGAAATTDCTSSTGYSASVSIATPITRNISGVADGNVALCVIGRDTAGNYQPYTAATTATWIKDTIIPVATISGQPTGVNTASALNVDVAGTDIQYYQYKVGTTVTTDCTSATGYTTAIAESANITDTISALGDGNITLCVVGENAASIWQSYASATTATWTRDATAPSGYSANINQTSINVSNQTALSFSFTGAEVGSTYNYSINGIITGSGMITSATQMVPGIDVSGLSDGTLNLSVTLTDTAGNAGTAATDTVAKDSTAPSGYTAGIDQTYINSSNLTALSITFAGAEVGSNYTYTISSSGGGGPVTGSGAVGSPGQTLSGIDASGLGNGTLSLSFVLTDAAGNTGIAATDTALKDTAAPSGYSVNINQTAINGSNQTNFSFTFAGAEVGAAYNYSITGGGTISGSGTVSATNETVSGINVSPLSDGTLTLSVTLTDTAGNAGAAATDTVTKDVIAPSGYSVAIDQASINNGNATALSFTCSGTETGTAYAYTITSTGGGTPVIGNGTITGPTQNVSGINVSGLGDGTLTLNFFLTDTAGNAGSNATGSVAKDALPPVVVITGPAGGSAVNGTAVISFTDSELTAPEVSVDNINWHSATSGVTTLGSISLFMGLPQGSFTLYLRDTDAGGSTGTYSIGLIKDTVGPNVNITAPAAGLAVSSWAYIYFTDDDLHSPQVSVDNINWTSASSGTTPLISIPQFSGLSEGAFTLYLRDVDAIGNIGTNSINLVKDTTPPAVAITSPNGGANYTTNVASHIVSGTCDANTTMSASGVTFTDNNCSDGTWALDTINLSEGPTAITVNGTDPAGNIASAQMVITLDTIPPTVAIGAPSSSLINGSGSVSYSITYTDASSINLTNGDVVLNTLGATCSSKSVSNGNTSTPTVTLSGCSGDGTVGISIAAGRSSDTAGNMDIGAGPGLTFTVDAIPPAGYNVSFDQTYFNSSSAGNVSFTYYFAESGTTYHYTISSSGGGTDVTGSGIVSGASQSITGINCSGLGDGTLTVSFYLTDTAGNSGSAMNNTATKDTVSPTVSIGSPMPPIINGSGSVNYNVLYSGANTINLTNSDVTLNTTGGANCGTVSVTGGNSPTPVVTLSNCTGSGTVGITIAASRSHDNANNYDSGATGTAFTVDAAPPTIVSAVTMDADNNGRIDHYKITFDKNINDGSFIPGNWAIGDYTGITLVNGGSAPAGETDTINDTIIYLRFDEKTFPDTGAIPDISANAGGIQDMSGNSLAAVYTADVAEKDGARPRIESVVGAAGSDRVTVTFTEPVDNTPGTSCTGTASSLAYNSVNGFASGIVGWQDNDGCDDATVVFLTDTAVNAADIDADTVMPPASIVYDNAGNTAMPVAYPINGLLNSVKFKFDTTVNGAFTTGPVSDFPVLIRIHDPIVLNAVRDDTAPDIRFVDSVADSGAVLPYQIERWNKSNGAAEVWVLVPTIAGNSNTDYITMYYGEKTAGTVPGRQEPGKVFSTGNQFAGVWHLAQPTGSTAYDSTANKNNSTLNSTTQQYNGLIGPSQYFDGVSHIEFDDTAINNGDALDGVGGLMLSAWVKPDNGDSFVWQSILSKQNMMTDLNGYQLMIYTYNASEQISCRANNSSVDIPLSANTINTDWYYLAAYINSGTSKIYLNGANTGATISGTPLIIANEMPLMLGRQGGGGFAFTGYMDEVRVENSDRGADWIKLCYENQRMDQTLVKAWYNSAWQYRIKITIPAAQVTGTVPDFPVYVNLADLPTSFWTNVKINDPAGNGDIVITAGDGMSKLPRELVSFSDNGTTGTGELWFKAPSLSNVHDNTFYIYYDNVTGTETNDSASVWSNGYIAVWHFEDMTFPDSAPNTLGLAGYSGVSISSGVLFSNCANMTSGTNYIYLMDKPKLHISDTATLSAWIRPNSLGSTMNVLSKTDGSNGFDMQVQSTPSYWVYSGSSPAFWGVPLNAGISSYYTATFDYSNCIVYHNGSSLGNTSITPLVSNTSNNLFIGTNSNTMTDDFNGWIDEVHISNVVRPAAWISTEYNNQSAPASFCTFGPQETP